MCESGAWNSFDNLEENLTLDELFILYEMATERQSRMLKTVASALGASVPDQKDETVVATGPIMAEGQVLFDYQQSGEL
jgi:hypothetical protein